MTFETVIGPGSSPAGRSADSVHRQRVVDDRDRAGDADMAPLEPDVAEAAVAELGVTDDPAVVRRIQKLGARRRSFRGFGVWVSIRGVGPAAERSRMPRVEPSRVGRRVGP